MQTLAGKKVVVIGGSMGVGRATVALAHQEGADVLAVARTANALDTLAAEFPGVATMVADAASPETPELILSAATPDVVVLSAGAIPPGRPFFDLDWEEFSANWNADVKASFLLCKAAIDRPFPRGATIILISSGAAIGGSPLSGGYAGAKRMQMFLAKYSQREAERLGLEMRFLAMVPGGIMAQTRLGTAAIERYASYLNTSPEEYAASFQGAPSPEDVARATIDFASGRKPGAGAYLVKADGAEALV